ncbi:MAG: superoxide dismutase [Candidatus Magasanikbacteria bacterium CG10_big_fil_rev_8_21_14_0_10_47_10]|uniref:superoxide dismutase n=1 Tax=Candidatus Magasanikbacteria bacterium CG10_big_fil_rev_8_21_14_0_10_47_10 TaxID=1974652 RepID=A0A2H0TRR1_9BACT|nr:MAG: superoxide dismutase [Candidatus Magasanikbacteria bacterium CG10_big_fil_rev_8_21_14_0_10_47_10]
MKYTAKDYSGLLGTQGFSDNQLNVHFKLYEGYVANTNKVIEQLEALSKAGDFGPAYAELKRRFGWEFDGMRMHEYYFDNMSKEIKEMDASGKFAALVAERYGSVDAWRADFVATGAMRGIGWAVCALDEKTNILHNAWVNEHDAGQLAGAKPLLVMDVFEHAFVFDYGMKRAEYIDAFMNAVNWEEVDGRLD